MQLGHKYFLSVTHPGGAAGSNDFYYLDHYTLTGNPVEAAETVMGTYTSINDTSDKATKVTAPAGQTTSAFFEGDIDVDADVDWYAITVPTGLTNNTVSLSCGAQRSGSGVRDFTMSLFKDDGTTLVDPTKGTLTETASTDAFIQALSVPSGATKLLVKVEAKSAGDTTVTSRFYRCGVNFQ